MHLVDLTGTHVIKKLKEFVKAYLHDDCICHLDLKPTNILFDEKMVPNILDYGFESSEQKGD
jgi:serine/threonine protein kinase